MIFHDCDVENFKKLLHLYHSAKIMLNPSFQHSRDSTVTKSEYNKVLKLEFFYLLCSKQTCGKCRILPCQFESKSLMKVADSVLESISLRICQVVWRFLEDPNAETEAKVVSCIFTIQMMATEAKVHKQNTGKQNPGHIRENTRGAKKRRGTSKQ